MTYKNALLLFYEFEVELLALVEHFHHHYSLPAEIEGNVIRSFNQVTTLQRSARFIE